MKKVTHAIISLNASEFAVLSFLLISLVGSLLVFHTESARPIQDVRPAHTLVKVIPQDSQKVSEDIHTTVKRVEYEGIRFVDALFTSVSALCVTGLITIDFSEFTMEGKIVVLCLMQLGGFGIIVFTAILAISLFRGVPEDSPFRKVIAETVDSRQHDVQKMIRYIFIYTVFFEGTAILIMGIYLSFWVSPELINNSNPWWWATFHAVSAFNNAGFSLLNNNLANFVRDPVISLTISALIILGGLGYPVLIAIYLYCQRFIKSRREKALQALSADVSGIASKIQVKVALVGTAFFLIIGTILIFWIEQGNTIPEKHGLFYKILAAWFQSATARTAGFNTMDIGSFHAPTLFLLMLFMFVGANPAGTAGGVKIPTIAVLYGYIKDWFQRPNEPVVLMGERVSRFAVSHAIRLFFFSTVFVASITALINYIERDYVITSDNVFNFTNILFETTSAFGTVGLSMGYDGGVTSFAGLFSVTSKYLIIITMLFGRVGPLVVLAALPWKRRYADAPPSRDYDDVQKIQIG